MISEACDAAEFARAAVGWDRLRIEAEAERELQAAERLWRNTTSVKQPPPAGCRTYITFLVRLGEWLRCGTVPPYARRGTREPLLVIAEALVRRGQLDPSALPSLRGKPRKRG